MRLLSKLIIAAGIVAAFLHAVLPGLVPFGIAPTAVVLLGLAYGAVAVDAEDATDYLVVVVAVVVAASTDVFADVHVVGAYLNAMLDQVANGLGASAVTVLAERAVNRIGYSTRRSRIGGSERRRASADDAADGGAA